MRGGTSKGAFFLESDLPSDPLERDELLLRIMGSPDARQIDGVGGAHPLTTKVAVVSPTNRDDADVEYLFLQPGVNEPRISDRQNCGNMLAAVGPFAVERGLLSPPDGRSSIRIWMRNTDGLAIATFPVASGSPVYDGDTAISGVPGTASRIDIEFVGIAGGTTGSLLPTGSVVNEVEGIEATLIDNGMPVVVMRAQDVGVTGYETCAELEANEDLRNALESIRLATGTMMGLGDVSEATIPKLTMVSSPKEGGNVSTRTFIPHRCHASIGVLGAVTVATACLLPGSPGASVAESKRDSESFLLEHPTGTMETTISLSSDDPPAVLKAGIVRTARMLMDGVVFPRSY
jgi:4-oxalomesaconate tautomerase